MIDAHHHIWRQADLPWLLGPEQPRIFGSYAAIKRDYPIEEYLSDVQGSGITGSVYVQANWAPNWAVDEAAWVQAEADRTGWPMAIVAYADFTRGDVGKTLKKLADIPGVRGIRQQFHWHENPTYRFAKTPDLCTDTDVQKRIALLAEYGWSFDLQVFAGQMAGAVTLARACPEVTFILQHNGMLEDRSKTGVAVWKAGMTALAACPNVVTKLSAFGTFIHRNDPKFITAQVKDAIALFGAERCIYGSNFPIEKLWTSYADLWAAFRKAVPKPHQQQIFNDTAVRVYRLGATTTKGDA
ncbi:amidohydrolase family protein [Roseobacter sinensis]|uniref:Amidohydrolase family protein n=1 Tax=Roseobacter sinensis TaxID=2931391 RepID=A0ABT3BIK6_9RHOB|nr:amidohydrolase family protein [Roseobacter sp. WL0113]MCV3273411.1 amidohydrolase family protein [Roseobacter sp. WL0113]